MMKKISFLVNFINGWTYDNNKCKIIIFVSTLCAAVFFGVAKFTAATSDFAMIVGAIFTGTSLVAWYSIEGNKRQTAIDEARAIEFARKCPDKVETPDCCPDFLKNRDDVKLHHYLEGGIRDQCDEYYHNKYP